jgi:hypothetical protein
MTNKREDCNVARPGPANEVCQDCGDGWLCLPYLSAAHKLGECKDGCLFCLCAVCGDTTKGERKGVDFGEVNGVRYHHECLEG